VQKDDKKQIILSRFLWVLKYRFFQRLWHIFYLGFIRHHSTFLLNKYFFFPDDSLGHKSK
jgi:hypothetical protein